jgi:hypothetical protein
MWVIDEESAFDLLKYYAKTRFHVNFVDIRDELRVVFHSK